MSSLRGKIIEMKTFYQSTLGIFLLWKMLMSLASFRKYICNGYSISQRKYASGHVKVAHRDFAVAVCIVYMTSRNETWGLN